MIELLPNIELIMLFSVMACIAVFMHIAKSLMFRVIFFVISIIAVVYFINIAPSSDILSYIVLDSVSDNVNSHDYSYTTYTAYFMSYELAIIIVFTYMSFMIYKMYSAIRQMLA